MFIENNDIIKKMQTNKILVLHILLFLFLGCKKNINAQQSLITSNTVEVKKKEPQKSTNVSTDKIQEKSFVVSCGSGCALTYTVEQITKNESSYKIKFKVEMYEDEVLSDTYYETYFFIYNSNKISKIVLEGSEKNVLETLPKNAIESFTEFAEKLNNNPLVNNADSTFRFSNSILPYLKKINIHKVTYQSMNVSGIKGLSDFACGENKIRYIALNKKENLSLILVPMDCGDFPYRFYLISIFDSTVVSNLYVEGKSYEPENNKTIEQTSFTIDKNSILRVKTINKDFEKGSNEEKKYQISDKGNLIEVK